MIGIYKIENKVNGKVYIGQSANIKKRWKQHIYELNSNKHTNCHLLSAWNKYGKDNFIFEIICQCDLTELNKKEIYYIEQFKSYNENYGYNMTIGGQGNSKYYDVDLIVSIYNKTNQSILKTSKILGINESKISEILNELNIRDIKSPKRKIIGMDPNDYSVQYEFDSINEAYKYFGSSVTNQINKSIKDSKYIAFDCVWFDRDDYIKYGDNIEHLFNITKYKETTKYDDTKQDDYTHTHKTKVICITTGKVFNSIYEAAKYYGIRNENGICYCCSYKRHTCGGLSWMYLDEYEYMMNNQLTIEDMKSKYKQKNVTKKVVCLNNGVVFNSIVDANKYARLSIYSGKISEVCQGKRENAGRDENNIALNWMYYEDYKKLIDLNMPIIVKNKVQKNKFVCLNTNEIFDNINSAMDFSGQKSRSRIYDCCKGKKKFAGKHPITKEPLRWMYYKDYINMVENEKKEVV